DLVGIDVRDVHDATAGDLALEVKDPAFDDRLTFLGGGVFGVLFQVAALPCFSDGLFDGFALNPDQVVEFILKHFLSQRCHWTFTHNYPYCDDYFLNRAAARANASWRCFSASL